MISAQIPQDLSHFPCGAEEKRGFLEPVKILNGDGEGLGRIFAEGIIA
jgi:hypothetical protein